MSEYISYFERTDLPTNMWAWIPFEDAKALFATPVEERSRLGMDAGEHQWAPH